MTALVNYNVWTIWLFFHLLVHSTIHVSCWLSQDCTCYLRLGVEDTLERFLVCLIWLIWCNWVNDFAWFGCQWLDTLCALISLSVEVACSDPLWNKHQKQKVGLRGKWKEISESWFDLMLMSSISVCSLVSFFNALKDV